jgi:uncharacterized protein YyaL (SSP411 family)
MAPRLRNQTSPYLLQHADNPVDWWPWGDEAFAAARERGVPVLLSVGYSACHWCHVMAHESFEDEQTAALMNEHLVSIKVDREERPDVDSVYMTATQAMTGQGGWPMTVFMTPDREPFFCGTYFPRAQFQRLVLGVAKAWQEDRAQVGAQAAQIAAALAGRAAADGPDGGAESGAGSPAAGLVTAGEAAVSSLEADFDAGRGGFGGAPKFPPSMVLEFLLRHAERPGAPRGPQGLAMASATAEAMARGGMYDQLAGGFARYSVDADWIIPHFEKMLYDNALLARVYTHLWRRTGSVLARRVAEQTCDWMLAELRTPGGGFASALDADSDGAEGAFYVWTPDELARALGPEDGAFAAATFGVTSTGTFEHGSSVLQLRSDPADQSRLDQVRSRLLAARAERTRPGRDDKVVAAWNGLAIAALAETGLLLDRPDFVAAAEAAAELLAGLHVRDGRIVRTSRDGTASASPGVLEDYGSVAEGLIALAGATGSGRWLDLAGQLLETALTRFRAPGGGFYDTADDSEKLIYRPAEVADGPSPSGTFAVAGALLSYAALTGSQRHRDAAVAALADVPALAVRYPRAAGWGLAVAEAVLSGPVEVAVVGPPTPERAELHVTALMAAPPGAVIAVGDGSVGDGSAGDGAAGDGAAAEPAPSIPLLAGRTPVNGAAAAYVCRDFTCRAPVTAPGDLRAALAVRG